MVHAAALYISTPHAPVRHEWQSDTVRWGRLDAGGRWAVRASGTPGTEGQGVHTHSLGESACARVDRTGPKHSDLCGQYSVSTRAALTRPTGSGVRHDARNIAHRAHPACSESDARRRDGGAVRHGLIGAQLLGNRAHLIDVQPHGAFAVMLVRLHAFHS